MYSSFVIAVVLLSLVLWFLVSFFLSSPISLFIHKYKLKKDLNDYKCEKEMEKVSEEFKEEMKKYE